MIQFSKNNTLNPVSNIKYGCNCRSKESCPFQNKCLTLKIVYQAYVKNYLGVTETHFKERFGNHMRNSNTPNTEIALSYQNIYGNS